ncbi:hypothetical protein TRVL_04238 [Trypanosoma vivax]|uniref:Uncharacterized protein n=1 Tax=Trypanosoma vivax (strain Y486) TaxID=1055687 RepID=G0TXL9_TRYVY|nr:hypothetical protein TRVL_04238 [Trypanosoma vivax]CCC48710.1 conserved hypothetical protein [Trypanosoma vivax Y486]
MFMSGNHPPSISNPLWRERQPVLSARNSVSINSFLDNDRASSALQFVNSVDFESRITSAQESAREVLRKYGVRDSSSSSSAGVQDVPAATELTGSARNEASPTTARTVTVTARTGSIGLIEKPGNNKKTASISAHPRTLGQKKLKGQMPQKSVDKPGVSGMMQVRGRALSLCRAVPNKMFTKVNVRSVSRKPRSASRMSAGKSNQSGSKAPRDDEMVSEPAHTIMNPLPFRTLRSMYTTDVVPFAEREKSAPSQEVGAAQNNTSAAPGAEGPFSYRGRSAPGAAAVVASMADFSPCVEKGQWDETPTNIIAPVNAKVPVGQFKLEDKKRATTYYDVWCLETQTCDDTGASCAEFSTRVKSSHYEKDKTKKMKKQNMPCQVPSNGDRGAGSAEDYQVAFFKPIDNTAPGMYAGPSTDWKGRVESPTREEGLCSSIGGCALLKKPRELLATKFLKNFSLPMSLSFPIELNGDEFTISRDIMGSAFHDTGSQKPHYVSLSYPARVLYAALLYLRALGGFPTLKRISPLFDNSDVVEKEHCLELVFASFGSGRSHKKSDIMTAEFKITEERVVIMRSVLAEKVSVNRFGRNEMVHILPPLGSNESFSKTNESETEEGPANTPQTYMDPSVQQLLKDVGVTVNTPALQSGSGPRARKRVDGKDYGDLAVVFLMDSKPRDSTGLPPEPLEFEALRYRVFSLQKRKERDLRKGRAEIRAAQRRMREQEKRNSFLVELSKIVDGFHPGWGETCAPRPIVDKLSKHFPAYRPVTVAESTLIRGGNEFESLFARIEEECKLGLGKQYDMPPGSQPIAEDVDCIAPSFHRLLFSRLHEDVFLGILYSLEVQLLLGCRRRSQQSALRSPGSNTML